MPELEQTLGDAFPAPALDGGAARGLPDLRPILVGIIALERQRVRNKP